MQNNAFTLQDFLNKCPVERFDLYTGPSEDVVQQLLIDLQYVSELIHYEFFKENEFFILINQDFNLSIKKFLENYNKTLGQQFPLKFLSNYLLETAYFHGSQFYAIIITTDMHINYFKLVNDIKNLKIYNLADNLKRYEIKDDLPEDYYNKISSRINALHERMSIKTSHSISY